MSIAIRLYLFSGNGLGPSPTPPEVVALYGSSDENRLFVSCKVVVELTLALLSLPSPGLYWDGFLRIGEMLERVDLD